MKFSDLGLLLQTLEAIEKAGFKEPAPPRKDNTSHSRREQYHSSGSNRYRQGSGVCPARTQPNMRNNSLEVVVTVPTRELAMQVSDEMYRFGRHADLRTATAYGGTPYGKQTERVRQVSIVIATPGRLQDLLKSARL